MTEKKDNNVYVPIAIIFAGLIIGAAIIVSGSDFSINKLFGKGASEDSKSEETASAPSGNGDQQAQFLKVSVGNAPFLGDASAPITVIEYSDYECPYCGASVGQNSELMENFKARDSSWKPLVPNLIENYVKTGKVKYVFKDMPLPFHDPVSTNESLAANCARDQGGNEMYFKYHDKMFELSKYNGTTPASAVDDAAEKLGLNMNEFTDCIKSGKYLDEIDQNKADFQKLSKEAVDKQLARGLGTPTYFVGKTVENGEIDGYLISGAQSFSLVEQMIESMLQEK